MLQQAGSVAAAQRVRGAAGGPTGSRGQLKRHRQPQMRLPSAAMLEDRLALEAVVMRKWQGNAWRASEAARPHTSLGEDTAEGEEGQGAGQQAGACGRRMSRASPTAASAAPIQPQPLNQEGFCSPKEGGGRFGGRAAAGGQSVPRQR